ncbi:unnamed protein product [Kluyveromyces dobzhanskii CBS 2104]|uniref:WGS project CCBQ000000000 data, contig 00106 n=1 Tax=Kluyveromyces dobzhanskii CBS 2104 TaxID=1427455 RepID=A0A0A8L804_9SACH|nr:unnamed protein product [Kluyveromyces dobzhanskii CBS 2104]
MDLLKILDTAPDPAIVDAQTMGVSGDTSGDYWLPASMCLYQKELTDQIVSLHYSDILKYFETSDYKEDIVIGSMKSMCLNSEYVATHPYLLIDHFMPKSLITKDIPGHLAETSGKFAVLRDLISLVQDYETHTIIMARSGRTMDLLEALLLGNKVNIVRYDGQTVKTKNKPKNFSCTCHLICSDNLEQLASSFSSDIRVDMVVCLDPTCDPENSSIRKIRLQNRPKRGTDSFAPAIRLTTINSIDHCELYFGKNLKKDSREYLVNVTAAVVVLRDIVGTLPPDLRPIYSQNLRYLSGWLNNPNTAWPLPDVYPISIYTAMDVEKSLLTEVNYSQTGNDLKEQFINDRKRRNKGHLKERSSLFYYKSKRIKNEYSTNPLKQDMAVLTWVSASGQKNGELEYHLATEILTHKLIQSIENIYDKNQKQKLELEDFAKMDPVQNQHYEKTNKDFIEIKDKYAESQKKLNDDDAKAKNLLRLSEDKHKEIECVDQEINDLMKKLESKTESHKLLKDLLVEISSLQNVNDREQRNSDSMSSERTYMKKEIERAIESIAESNKEQEKLKEEINQIKTEMEESAAKNQQEVEDAKQRVDLLKSQMKQEGENLGMLHSKLGYITDRLSKIQSSRGRQATNGRSKK